MRQHFGRIVQADDIVRDFQKCQRGLTSPASFVERPTDPTAFAANSLDFLYGEGMKKRPTVSVPFRCGRISEVIHILRPPGSDPGGPNKLRFLAIIHLWLVGSPRIGPSPDMSGYRHVEPSVSEYR